ECAPAVPARSYEAKCFLPGASQVASAAHPTVIDTGVASQMAEQDLFDMQPPEAPLAERMRPRSLDEIVGQRRLLGEQAPLRRAIEAGRVHSMVLWGPPGCGKTTLARLLARYADAEYRALSAVLSGLPEVRKVLAEAQARHAAGGRTVLFVDEVHRFNK